ncbi:MFS transporter [Sutcliffiella rhizosphaerae]|uniref:Enterobactin exporter EntS n=1 Tax=Sutcliffiella rhizosphaerae TaxID=2880967 RepID=A0ABM8YR56_9BACI|nr:MFS transporter [Sutcliffiella rhizosphaerae]CAG9622462.1 Enterobactin exporter EntS [Sutcliffiella rhizosphaerae]
MKHYKYAIYLLTGIGVSHLGSWIYLVALNLSILNLTGSAAAVAGLYIIRPIAMLLTNTWSGSVVDRVNKRRLMISIDIIRGILVCIIPFISHLWIIYFIILLINIAGAFFGPSSSVYITRLIPVENRKRFNSLMSMTSYGAFLIGPAIAGFLIMFFNTSICIWINGIAFLVCSFFLYLLPNVDEESSEKAEPIRFQTLVSDWKAVKDFALQAKFFISVYLLFQIALLMGFALDSQEVTFIKQHLQLTDRDYGLIMSLTGLGALVGATVSAMVAKKVSLKLYLGGGMLLTAIGYVAFYASFDFLTATAAFVFLGFFMAFANAGYATFFQNTVPVNIMGRFASIADMFQGFVQILLTLLLGFLAEWFSLQFVCIVFAVVGTLFATILLLTVMGKSKDDYFREETKQVHV